MNTYISSDHGHELIPVNLTENRKNFLNQVAEKFLLHWPVFILSLSIFLTGAWTYLQLVPPAYESSARLLIKDEKKGMDDSRMIESLNLISTKKLVENEIEILKSRTLMTEVVDKLRLYSPVYRKSIWGFRSAYSSSPVRVEADVNTVKPTISRVPFQYHGAVDQVTIDNVSYPVNKWVETKYGLLRFVPGSLTGIAKDSQLYFSLYNPRMTTAKFMESLKATSSSRLSTVIDLKFKNEDPRLAEDVLNELILVYNRTALNEKKALAENTLAFVEERLRFIGDHLDSTESKLQDYKSQKGAVDIGSQSKLFLENVSENDRKVGDINMKLAVLGQVENYVKEGVGHGSISTSTLGVDDPVLISLLDKLFEVELQVEKFKRISGENSPVMLSLSAQAEKLRTDIKENISNQRRGLEAGKNNLANTNSTYSSLLQAIPQKERDLVEITRLQSIENKIYTFLLQKREEAALSSSSTVADNRIVDKAEAGLLPVSPNKKLIYLLCVVLAIATGFFIVAARDMFSRTILNRSEIEQLTSIPVIGEISLEKSKKELVVLGIGNNLVSEQFRRLRSSLRYFGLGQTKKILITSSVPGEGKSFVTANLGLTLALAGKKVIVVEADLSNPSLSETFKIVEEKGLSGYLVGLCEPEEIIRRVEFNSNLFVLPAGEVPSNPSELLMDGKLEQLLIYLGNIFDYVLVDTAPTAVLSDAFNISPYCDATLYVVRHMYTPKKAIGALDKNNRINHLNNASIVFNGVRFNRFVKADFSYGSGYVYDRKYHKKTRRLTQV